MGPAVWFLAGNLGFGRAYTFHLTWAACHGQGLRRGVEVGVHRVSKPRGAWRGSPKIITMHATVGSNDVFGPDGSRVRVRCPLLYLKGRGDSRHKKP